MTNYDIIRREILNDKVVYFEWEFEEIAFKYVNDDNLRLRTKDMVERFPYCITPNYLQKPF